MREERVFAVLRGLKHRFTLVNQQGDSSWQRLADYGTVSMEWGSSLLASTATEATTDVQGSFTHHSPRDRGFLMGVLFSAHVASVTGVFYR